MLTPPGPPPVTPLSHLGSSQPVLAGEAAVARGALWRKRRRSELEGGEGFWGAAPRWGGHTPSLRVVPRGRQHPVHRGLLSCLPRRRVRGHLGVLQVPAEEKGVTKRGGPSCAPPTPPVTTSPRGAGRDPTCGAGAGAGGAAAAGVRPAALRLVNEARGECPRGGGHKHSGYCSPARGDAAPRGALLGEEVR